MSDYRPFGWILLVASVIAEISDGHKGALMLIASALFFIAHEIKQNRGDT